MAVFPSAAAVRAVGKVANVALDRHQQDETHLRPAGVDDQTVEALGELSKALEITERARGHLYSFHQLTGGADLTLDKAVTLLRQAGHDQQARLVEQQIIGRNVIPGQWTFEIIEAYNRTYYRPFVAVEERVRTELAEGKEHLFEAEMKAARRTGKDTGPSA